MKIGCLKQNTKGIFGAGCGNVGGMRRHGLYLLRKCAFKLDSLVCFYLKVNFYESIIIFFLRNGVPVPNIGVTDLK